MTAVSSPSVVSARLAAFRPLSTTFNHEASTKQEVSSTKSTKSSMADGGSSPNSRPSQVVVPIRYTSRSIPFPPSQRLVADDPFYPLLYDQNEAATVQFLLDGKPFPFDLLEHNKLFVVAILSQEPGPIIDYAQLAICIRTLRDMASYTPNYKDLDIYLDNLLSVHTRWKQAAMLYHSYVTYTTMVSGLFITHSDPDPLSLVRNMPPPAQNLMSRVRQHHLLPKTQLHIQHELHLRKTYHSMHYAQLSALKTSTLLSQNLDRLSHALRLHDEYLAERHEERNEAITKLNNLTTRIASHMTSHHGIQQQFGQLGSVSMHPETLDAVLAVHHDITNEYFPSYIEEGFAKQCAEVEEQVDSGRFKAQHGFETWSDCQGRMRGVGCDEESGVWYGESRMDI